MDLHPVEGEATKTFETVAKQRLRENVPLAVSVLSHSMLYSENEPLRARVAQYMVDRVIGKADATPLVTQGDDDLLTQIMNNVVVQQN